MKLYLYPQTKTCVNPIKKVAVLAAALLISLAGFSQELIFKNPTLASAAGTDGQDNAIYRFKNVTTNVDALVTINGRSSSQVKLVSIDLPGQGWDKAFQPQVTYGDGKTPNGITEWWME